MNLYLKTTVFVLVITLNLVGCNTTPESSDTGEYKRGNTTYRSGTLTVEQPDIKTIPERSVRGIRVAGPDTDLVVSYWNTLLSESNRDTSLVFEEFRARYKDLTVYNSGAADAALQEFKRWSRTKNFLEEFNSFWDF